MAVEGTLGPAEVFTPGIVAVDGSAQQLGGRLAGEPPLLSIVIPALNEEESIGSTVQRCLDARSRIDRWGASGALK
jgi:hypothetical protein